MPKEIVLSFITYLVIYLKQIHQTFNTNSFKLYILSEIIFLRMLSSKKEFVKIKGTFSGDAKRIFFNEVTQTVEEFPVNITNGIFELQRNPNQN